MDARRKYNISFDILDLKSFKRSAPNHGWAYIIFILKDGTTFPALHFHNGGSKALLKELENFIHIRRSPNDPRLFLVKDHDPEQLSQSINELSLFTDSSGAYVQMTANLETWSKKEIRAVIRFLNAKSLNTTEIHKELQSAYGEHVISLTQVYHWCNLFEAGHSDLTDREGRGHLITVTSEDNVKGVDELIHQDRRLKLHEIASSLETLETSAHRIVFDELGYRKVSARWVPKQLTDNHKEQRWDICRELLRRSKSSRRVHGHTANAGGDFLGYDGTFLDSIITGDETWLHDCTPEIKQDSMTWKHPSSPVGKKFKVMRSAKKIMGTVFWDSRGVLLFETLQPGETINAARYCQTLDKLREAIRRKRPGQLTNGVILQHDNATLHTARVT
ncbi:histone-lysine N-methyltransferase SETMAR [Elysia marginata]|uniref:Histone-lysine N-methyltransferase SETMAR n=1 Tax=Elysia marginata TaxID=1093978 RepID=A0AAV4HE10_9GAST|nr:histone-lysine N-methyltransferase SETMAR [Elysia marginata]